MLSDNASTLLSLGNEVNANVYLNLFTISGIKCALWSFKKQNEINGDLLEPVLQNINAQRELTYTCYFILGIWLKLFLFKQWNLPEWKN